MEYRAILHNPDNGTVTVKSIWVSDKDKANEIGEQGLDFYGGTHFTIEERETD